MIQIAVFLFIGLSVFLTISVPFLFTKWQGGRKLVYQALAGWVTLVAMIAFLNSLL